MTFEETFGRIKAQTVGADAGKISGKLAVQVNLTGEGAGTFYIEILDGKLSVEPYDYHDRDVLMTISGEDFLRFMEGKLDPVAAFMSGKLKAEGDLGRALELKKLMER